MSESKKYTTLKTVSRRRKNKGKIKKIQAFKPYRRNVSFLDSPIIVTVDKIFSASFNSHVHIPIEKTMICRAQNVDNSLKCQYGILFFIHRCIRVPSLIRYHTQNGLPKYRTGSLLKYTKNE